MKRSQVILVVGIIFPLLFAVIVCSAVLMGRDRMATEAATRKELFDRAAAAAAFIASKAKDSLLADEWLARRDARNREKVESILTSLVASFKSPHGPMRLVGITNRGTGAPAQIEVEARSAILLDFMDAIYRTLPLDEIKTVSFLIVESRGVETLRLKVGVSPLDSKIRKSEKSEKTAGKS